MTEKRFDYLKKADQKLDQNDMKTLKSINKAWKEIKNGKGGKAKTSKFFEEFAKW